MNLHCSSPPIPLFSTPRRHRARPDPLRGVFGATLCALFVAGLAGGCSFDERSLAGRGMQPMTGPEVEAVLGKTRYRWEAAAGATGTAVTTGDGRIRVMWNTGAANGRIRFTKTGYCSRFTGVRGGAEDCYRLYRTGPREYAVFKEDGTHSGRIAMLD